MLIDEPLGCGIRAIDGFLGALRAAEREAQRKMLLAGHARDPELLHTHGIGCLLARLRHQAAIETHLLLIVRNLRLQLADGASHFGALLALDGGGA